MRTTACSIGQRIAGELNSFLKWAYMVLNRRSQVRGMSRCRSPEQAKALSMPVDHRVRLYRSNRLAALTPNQ